MTNWIEVDGTVDALKANVKKSIGSINKLILAIEIKKNPLPVWVTWYDPGDIYIKVKGFQQEWDAVRYHKSLGTRTNPEIFRRKDEKALERIKEGQG